MGSAVTEDLNAVGSHWLTGFAAGLSTNSGEAVAQSFLPDGWLRDFCFLTWDTRALSGRASIASYVADGLAQPILGGPPSDFKLDLRPFLAPTLLEPASGTHGAIQIAFTFTTLRGSCRGSARLLKDEDDGEWRALCAFTMLDALKGHEEAEPELGVYNGQRMPWEDLKAQRKAKVEEDPIVIISASLG